MKSLGWAAAGLLLTAPAAAATTILRSNEAMRLTPPPLSLDEALPPGTIAKRAVGTGVFQQLIDHANPSLGTFAQRYWYSDEFYKGPGSPIVFFTPGEIAADRYTGYLTNRTITGTLAQRIGGAVVMMEHRYWGGSSPFEALTTANLRFLTLKNSIHDTTYFARHVSLPFDSNGTSSATQAPWVFSGGSYSGALAGWTASQDPGTFWAYHTSSGVVEAVADFWRYFWPVQQGMPANCSADVTKVVEYVDRVLLFGSPREKHALKAKFNLTGVVHDDDFAGVLENGPWQWQGKQFYSGYSSFDQWCDYVENVWPGSNKTAPGADGVGLEKALEGYAKWIREVLVPGYCEGYGYWSGTYNLDCFDTYNKSNPFFTDVSVDNTIDRQWMWFLCNEPFEYWQDGAPPGRPSLVSRLINVPYWRRQCALFFPREGAYTYGIAQGKSAESVNAWTDGWSNADLKRVVWTNGQWDPWRDSTVAAENRPGGPFRGTEDAPVFVIPKGIHCSDLQMRNAAANAGVQDVVDRELAVLEGWVGEFYAGKG